MAQQKQIIYPHAHAYTVHAMHPLGISTRNYYRALLFYFITAPTKNIKKLIKRELRRQFPPTAMRRVQPVTYGMKAECSNHEAENDFQIGDFFRI